MVLGWCWPPRIRSIWIIKGCRTSAAGLLADCRPVRIRIGSSKGIVGASDGTLNVGQVKKLLSDMKGRQFLLNSVHLDDPLLFETRWVMSYLKGPMSNSDIKKLMMDKKESVGPADRIAEPSTAEQASSISRPPEIMRMMQGCASCPAGYRATLLSAECGQ